jgi:hypothetical protein
LLFSGGRLQQEKGLAEASPFLILRRKFFKSAQVQFRAGRLVPVSVVIPVVVIPVAPAVAIVAVVVAVTMMPAAVIAKEAIITVAVAVPAARTPAVPAARARRLKFAPVILRLAAVIAVALDVPAELTFLFADAIAAIRRLGSCAGQQDSAQQDRPTQGCAQ